MNTLTLILTYGKIRKRKVVDILLISKLAFVYFARGTPCGLQPLHPAKTVEISSNYEKTNYKVPETLICALVSLCNESWFVFITSC